MSQMLSEFSVHAASQMLAGPAAESLCAAARPAQQDAIAAADSVLPAELIHGIEAVVTPTCAGVRSAAISGVLEEIYRTVEWLHGQESGESELASLAEVLAAARAHEARMAALDARA